MPNLRIETNVAKDKIDMKACLTELSKAMASTTGKPELYMVVQVGQLAYNCSTNCYL